MDAMNCPDEVQKELNLYRIKEEARERSEEEIWQGRKERDPHAHAYSLCDTHKYACEAKRMVLVPATRIIFPSLLMAVLIMMGVHWPTFVATHPWWFACAVLPVVLVASGIFADWFPLAAEKRYAKMVFGRCKECRKKYCDAYLAKQAKKRELRRGVVGIIIRNYNPVWGREMSTNEEMVLEDLYIGWADFDERVMVRDICREIGKLVPGFVFAMNKPCAGTYQLTYDPVLAQKT